MADKVMAPVSSIQRQSEEKKEPVQTQISLQRQTEEEMENFQTKLMTQGVSESKASDFDFSIASITVSGFPMGDGTRVVMESQIGADFCNVHLHTDSPAGQMSSQINAQAFTHGNNIYFNAGQYNPDTPEGKHFLAHELTHTVQQGASVQKRSRTRPSRGGSHPGGMGKRIELFS